MGDPLATNQVPAQKLRVVVIEDTFDNVELITTLLREDVGVGTVMSWASGAMFFRWFHDAPSVKLNPHYRSIDLVLLDLHIPREDGYSVLNQIRQTPELRGTPVVAVTATLEPSALSRCQGAGFNGFIGKPIRPRNFPNQITRILAGEQVWEPAS